MTVWVLWDVARNTLALDPLGYRGDGLCPAGVYLREDLARDALERAQAIHWRVELREKHLVDPPGAVADDLDELEPGSCLSPEVEALFAPAQYRSELEADG